MTSGEHHGARATVAFEFERMAIAVALSPRMGQVYDFSDVVVQTYDPQTTAERVGEPLRLQEEAARALYEALADYFGHSGHDTRSLRRDYDAERARVDKLIDATIAQASR